MVREKLRSSLISLLIQQEINFQYAFTCALRDYFRVSFNEIEGYSKRLLGTPLHKSSFFRFLMISCFGDMYPQICHVGEVESPINYENETRMLRAQHSK